MRSTQTTFAEFLIAERRRFPEASGTLNALLLDIALACKSLSKRVANGALDASIGHHLFLAGGDGSSEKLETIANSLFLRATEWNGHLAGLASEEMSNLHPLPDTQQKGKYLLIFDPLDGSSNIDVNVSVGSIFSILRAPHGGESATEEDFLQFGREQVCAGYAIYGPSTMLVLTVGTGVHGFTLDQQLGEFFLTHPSMSLSRSTQEFAINASNSRFWEPAVKRYVDECLAGTTGPRDKDFNMRWVASLVAEAHRVLLRGGVFLYPRDTKDPERAGRLRLLFEANPIAFIIEQAGGSASTGRERLLDVEPQQLHERIGFIFGSSDEVELVESYHDQEYGDEFDAPLFGGRGLFRETV
ncbi:MAG: fructose-1,6-bisphosphatase I/sedoheptulose-1,7-bisphosphatase [Gammaproteobacteria bacterium]|jgi:fructose-1,6-bisphosphatase I/sedoheptulose-1,7-bisphosphatase